MKIHYTYLFYFILFIFILIGNEEIKYNGISLQIIEMVFILILSEILAKQYNYIKNKKIKLLNIILLSFLSLLILIDYYFIKNENSYIIIILFFFISSIYCNSLNSMKEKKSFKRDE